MFRLLRISLIVMGVLLTLPIGGAGQTRANFGLVSGRVISKDGRPVTGIRVAALLLAPTGTTSTAEPATNGALMSFGQTDAEGRYRLENIAPGRYNLVAGPLDEPVYLPGVAAQDRATVLTIIAGAVFDGQDFNITVPIAVKVRGRVIREGHHAGTQINLTRSGGGGRASLNFNATIGPDGSFEFPAVRPGIYQTRISPGVSGLPATSVVVADTDIANLEIPIPLSVVDVAITVAVTLDEDGVLPRLQLQFMPAGPLPENAATVPGSFSTNGTIMTVNGAKAQMTLPSQMFPQMEYRVRVMPSGNIGLPEGYVIRSMAAGSVDLLTQPIRLTASMPTDIAIKLGIAPQTPWVRVEGHITGIDSTRAAPLSIALQGQTPVPLSVPVHPDGTFEFPTVLPGTYQVLLSPSTDQFSRSIVVQREDPMRVEIPLRISSFKVSGRTPDPLQKNKRIQARLMPEPSGPGNRPVSIPVAADGTFVFPAVQPGTYRAGIEVCESDECIGTRGTLITVDKDIENLSLSSASRDETLPPVSIANVPATFVNTATVGGVVVMENGTPAPRFRLKFTMNALTRSVTVDQHAFAAALPAGDHRVSVADLPDGFEVRSIADGTSDLAFWPLTISLPPNGIVAPSVPQRLKVVLGVTSPAPWVKVAGRIAGSSAGAVTVELTGRILADTLRATVGPDGAFAFPTVLPDTYTLRLLPGGSAAGQTIVVGAAGLNDLEIDAASR